MAPTTRPPEPTLPPMVDRRERARIALSSQTPEPIEGECLACFLVRSVEAYGCGGDLALVEAFRRGRAPAAVGVADRLVRLGADCACQVAPAGVWVLAREHRVRDLRTDRLEVPSPIPACHGVGPGSARPCALWERRGRRQPGAAASQARSTCGANASAIAE
ncbi:DUF2695 domain-containing protein [Nocardioidaceae bacterium]|nr:DUF2695 domain-containing protein [Nocardioidaceae bacterium]